MEGARLQPIRLRPDFGQLAEVEIGRSRNWPKSNRWWRCSTGRPVETRNAGISRVSVKASPAEGSHKHGLYWLVHV